MSNDIAERHKKTLYNDQGFSKYVCPEIVFICLSLDISYQYRKRTEVEEKGERNRNGRNIS